MASTTYRLSGGGFSRMGAMHEMFYDEFGAYLGQEQDNAEGGRDDPPTVFYRADKNEAGQFGLTIEDMENAVDMEGDLPRFALNPAYVKDDDHETA